MTHFEPFRSRYWGIVLLAGSLIGCEVIGFFAQAFSGGKVPAQYRLADRPTLVMVDDPSFSLGDPSLSVRLAGRVGFHLVEGQALSESNLISQGKLNDLAGRLGPRYPLVPMDEVGRELRAAQVIHVYVESVTLEEDVGVVRPNATLSVKLVDAATGKRLFPPQARGEELLDQTPAHPVQVSMFYRAVSLDDARAVRGLRQELVERLAVKIAQLFFDHEPDNANQKGGE